MSDTKYHEDGDCNTYLDLQILDGEEDYDETNEKMIYTETENVDCGNVIHPFKKTIDIWTDGDSKMLLDRYYEYLAKIGPLKPFRNKKEMWEKISTEIGKSWKQCEQRYKTILKRKKASIDNNRSSGHQRKFVQFEEELTKISKIDDSVEPEIQISSNKIVRKLDDAAGCSGMPADAGPKKEKLKKSNSCVNTLIEINKLKEEGRERRYKEKMERADRMEKMLVQILEKNKNE